MYQINNTRNHINLDLNLAYSTIFLSLEVVDNFSSLEVVDSDSGTQIQVTENVNLLAATSKG